MNYQEGSRCEYILATQLDPTFNEDWYNFNVIIILISSQGNDILPIPWVLT